VSGDPFLSWGPIIIGIWNKVCWLIPRNINACMIDDSRRMCSGSHDQLIFWKYNISETVQESLTVNLTWPIQQYQWPSVTLKVTFAIWKLSDSNTSENIADVGLCLLLARLMGQYCFARWCLSSSSVTRHICNVTRKTKQKQKTTHQGAARGGPVVLRHVSTTSCSCRPTACKAFKMFFVQLCSSWRDFNSHSALRGPFAISELLVRHKK